MKPLLLLTSILFASGVAFAQDTSPPKETLPDPPLMNSAPADCQWTITYTPKISEKDPVTPEEIGLRKMRLQYSPTVLSKNVLKSAGQTVVLTSYEAGLKSEGWVIGGYFYRLPMLPGEGTRVEPRGQGDFPDINWVTAENFRGTVDLKGTKTHLYETEATESHPSSSPSTSPRPDAASPNVAKVARQRVYIDAKTRLPVMVETNRTIITYKYAGPPTNFPAPNDRIKQIMREVGQTKKR